MSITNREGAIAAQATVIIRKALEGAREANWMACARDLERDWLRSIGDLRELLIVRDCAEVILDRLEANATVD